MQRVVINERYLNENIILNNLNKIIIIQSICGTGKSTCIAKALEDLQFSNAKVIIPTFRRTLCDFLKGLIMNTASYLDCHQHKIYQEDFPRVCISPESFYRYESREYPGSIIHPEFVIWDEFCSFIEHLCNPATLKGKERSNFISKMECMFKNPTTTVVICDAYFREEVDMQIIEMMAGGNERIVFVKNEYYEKKTKLMYYNWMNDGAKEWKKLLFHNMLDESKNIFIFSNCKSTVQGLEKELIDFKNAEIDLNSDNHISLEDRRIIISSDSCDNVKKLYSTNPDEVWDKKRVLYITPTIQAGVGFSKEHYHKSFGFAIQGSGSVLGFLQQLARPRNLMEAEVHIWLPNDLKCSVFENEDEIDVNNIWRNLEAYDNWTNSAISKYIEYEFIQQQDRTVWNINTRSILNSIFVRHIYLKVKQKISFVSELRRYIEYDWYDLQMGWFGEDYEDPKLKYMQNIMVTFRAAKQYRLDTWANIDTMWDGRWLGDEWLVENRGGCFEKFVDFSSDWGIFGVMGDLRYLKDPHFNIENLAKFGSIFCSPQQQRRFHDLLFVKKCETIMEDAREARFNTFQFDSLLYHGLSAILGCIGLFDFRVLDLHTEGEIMYYRVKIAELVTFPLPLQFTIKEDNLNYAETFEFLCEVLTWRNCWGHLIDKLDLKLLANTFPKWLQEKRINTRAIVDIRKLVNGTLRFIGLERGSKIPEKSGKKTVYFGEGKQNPHLFRKNGDPKPYYRRRINLNTYSVKYFTERAMISVCKLFKDNPRKTSHPNYVVPDPFSLLNFDKIPRNFELPNHYPDLTRFKFWPIRDEFYTEDWSESVKYWGNQSTQFSHLTHADNVLDRLDYWDPIRFPHQFHDDLPAYYVDRHNAAKEIQRKLPLRAWSDNPYKRSREEFEENE